MKLIKQMPCIADLAQTVRIVHPILDWRKMQARPLRIGRAPGVDLSSSALNQLLVEFQNGNAKLA